MPNPSVLLSDHRRAQLVKALKDNLVLLLGAVAVTWGIEILNTIFLGYFDRYGIQPCSITGLSGVLTSPFLHLGFGHLISNTLPSIMLGGLVLIGGWRVFLKATLFIILTGGLALWLLGPSATNHIGASGLIFGYLGFLLARGIVEKSLFGIVVSVVILLLYGRILCGVFPGQPGITWPRHLFGFMAGLLSARVIFSRKKVSSL
ncbi:rhomboid family intramembrane serine protease [Akkermansiaceae bacterium]|nr:rhomboid family intramembrane serine protease [Akkermansiaceae bacterium]